MGLGKVTGEPFSAAGYLADAPATSPLQGFFMWAAATPWLPDLTNAMTPQGEFLIGLGPIVGALVRLAAFFDDILMVFFYLGDAEWGHGVVNGDLFGLMMFAIVGMLAAGRILGLDAIIKKMEFVHQRPALKYLLGWGGTRRPDTGLKGAGSDGIGAHDAVLFFGADSDAVSDRAGSARTEGRYTG